MRLTSSHALMKLESTQSIMYSLCGVSSTGMSTWRRGAGSLPLVSSWGRWLKAPAGSVVTAEAYEERGGGDGREEGGGGSERGVSAPDTTHATTSHGRVTPTAYSSFCRMVQQKATTLVKLVGFLASRGGQPHVKEERYRSPLSRRARVPSLSRFPWSSY